MIRFLFVILLCSFVSCSEKEQKDQTNADFRGEWLSERRYSNKTFGFKVDIPDGWTLEKVHNEALNDMGSKIVSGDDQNMANALKEAAKRTHKVLAAFRYPVGTPEKTNPNIQIVIENIKNFPGIKDGSDYIKIVATNLSMSQLKVNFNDDTKEVKLGDSAFFRRTAVIPYGNMKVEQTYYSKLMNGHVMFITVTTMNDNDKKIIEPIINSMMAK